MKVRLQEAKLSEVLAYYGEGYTEDPSTGVAQVEVAAVDPARDRVVFRLYVREPTPEPR